MILVTGGTGLLGAHLLEKLTAENKQIRVIIRSESSRKNAQKVWANAGITNSIRHENIEWVHADITNRAELGEVFENIEQVYHCAAMISFNPKKKQEMYQVNVVGTSHIVDCCLDFGVKKLVHVSSIAAIGDSKLNGIIRETDQWPQKSKSPYTYTKTRAELEVWRGINEGLNAVIVNPSVILGSGIWDQGSARFFKLIGEGQQFYSGGGSGFVDVRDVVAVMIKLMNSDIQAERFILNAANLGYHELFNQIATALQVKSPSKLAKSYMLSLAWRFELIRSLITQNEPRITRISAKSASRTKTYSSEKIQQMLGFDFVPIEESISRIAIDYIRSQGQ